MSRRVFGNRGDVEDTDASSIVALVGVVAVNVLIVVDGGTSTFIVARLFGLLKVAYVLDVGHGQSKRPRTRPSNSEPVAKDVL